MWTLFFVLALFATMVLLIHLLIKLNELEKKTDEVSATLKKHYESR